MKKLWKVNCIFKILFVLLCLELASGIVFYGQAKAETMTTSVTIGSTPVCGDGSCNGSETCSTCPDDCGSCGGGGGGGGVPISTITTKVILQGKALPTAYLTILKDGQILTTTQADLHSDFEVEIIDITAGIYTFGIWAKDKNNIRSLTFSFTMNVISGVITTVSNIILPPTISLSSDSVKRGEALNISGQTVPQSKVEIHISSNELVEKVTADLNGVWFYNLNTDQLGEGIHSVRVRTSITDELFSTFSSTKLFTVGRAFGGTSGIARDADVNGDSRVNLVDFSILLYNWGISKNPEVDLNKDGWVDLIDFSIMLYWWTG